MSQELRVAKKYEAIMEAIYESARIMIGETKDFISEPFPDSKEDIIDLQYKFSIGFEDLVYINNTLVFDIENQESDELKCVAIELLTRMMSVISIQNDAGRMFTTYGYAPELLEYANLKAVLAQQCNNLEINFEKFESFYEKINWSFFGEITTFIQQIENEKNFGEWIFDKTPQNEGEPRNAPYVKCEDIVLKVVESVFNFVETHSKYNLPDEYMEILYDRGIGWNDCNMQNANVSELDDHCILALLIGVINADRFSDGTLVRFFENGCVLKWIKRLEEIENILLEDELSKIYNRGKRIDEQMSMFDDVPFETKYPNITKEEYNLMMLQKVLVKHKEKMEKDPEYKALWERREKAFDKLGLFDDSIPF